VNLGALASIAPRQSKSAPTGEPITEFEKAGKLGEFECGNCYWFKGSCGHPVMMRSSRQPRTVDGRVKVGEEDCCKFVRRVGRKESD